MTNASLSQNYVGNNTFELQLQDKFAGMLGTTLSPREPVDKRYDHLKMRIALLAIRDDEIKKLLKQVDLFKELIDMIDNRKLPKNITHFLHDVSVIDVQNKEQLQRNVSECKSFLMSFVQQVQQENIKLKDENDLLCNKSVALEKKYNETYMKNLFDLVQDKKTMQFFGAVIGLIVLMNAASYWNFNVLEHMIITGLGLCGFFSFVLRLYH
jgi:hypothetical protein